MSIELNLRSLLEAISSSGKKRVAVGSAEYKSSKSESIKKAKADAKIVVEEAKSKGQYISKTDVEPITPKGDPKNSNIQLKNSLRRMDMAYAIDSSAGSDSSFRINPAGIEHNAVVAEYLADWNSLPPELRQDANVAFHYAARLSASENADWTGEQFKEFWKVKREAINIVKELRENQTTVNGFDLKDDEIEQLIGTVGGGSRPTHSPEFYDATVVAQLTQPDVKKLVAEYKSALESTSLPLDQQTKMLEELNVELFKLAKNPANAADVKIVSPIVTAKIRGIDDQLNEMRRQAQERMHQEQRDKEFSTMWLSDSEVKTSYRDLKAGYEQWMRRVYRERFFSQEEAANHRISLLRQFAESEQFKEGYKDFHLHSTELSAAEIARYASWSENQWEEHFVEVVHEAHEYVEMHQMIKYAAAALHDGSKGFEPALGFMNKAGTRGWEVVYNGNRGLNGRAFELFDDELTIAMNNPDGGKPKRLTAEIIENAKNKARERIKLIYKDVYGENCSELTADHLVNVGEALADTRGRVVAAALRGRGPGEKSISGEPYIPSFQKAHYAEEILGVMDWVRYGPEKWRYLTPAGERQLELTSEFMGLVSGFDVTVDNMIKSQTAAGTYEANRDAALKKRWGEAGSGKRDYWKYHETHHGAMAFKKDEEYRRLLLADLGRQRLSEGLEMYFIDSSGWRIQLHLKQSNRLYTDAENHNLGHWLRLVGDQYLRADPHHQRHVFEHGERSVADNLFEWTSVSVNGRTEVATWSDSHLSCFSVLKKIGKFQPFRNGLWLYEKQNKDFHEWWNGASAQAAARALTGTAGNVNYIDAYRVAMDKYSRINVLLDQKGLGVIDYSQGAMNSSQMDQIIKVFGGAPGALTAEAQNYMNFMKTISDQVTKDAQILAFDDPIYRQYFKNSQFLTDARLGFLEDVRNLPDSDPNTVARHGVRIKEDDRYGDRGIRLSDNSTLEGQGGGDIMKRWYGDLTGFAMKIGPMLKPAFESTDKKALFKLFGELYGAESIYAGGQDALKIMTSMLYGYGEMGRVPYWDDLFGLEGFKQWYNSESTRYSGLEMGNRFSAVDLHHLKAEMDMIYGRLELYPELKEMVEKMEIKWGLKSEIFGKSVSKLGITTEFNDKMFSQQIIKWVAIATLILVYQASEEAKKGFGMSASEGGGHGGHH